MLNYIWGGLIISALVFALISDFTDVAVDRYRNDDPLPVTLTYPDGYQQGSRRVPVSIQIDADVFQAFYDTDATPDSIYQGTVIRTQEGTMVRFDAEASLPEPLPTILEYSASSEDELQGAIQDEQLAADSTIAATAIQFGEVKFPKLNAITAAAFEFAETAATIALGLIGVLALFLGLLQIAETAGLISSLVKVTQPVFRIFFPEIPDGHPALGMIVLNLTANVLGLGNAATPLGIKAMEELQKLNPTKETATNSMVMLLAMNTASVQLVPPALLVAVMGLQVNELIFPIIMVTTGSLIVAVTITKLLQRLPVYQATNPHDGGAERAADGEASTPKPSDRSDESDPSTPPEE